MNEETRPPMAGSRPRSATLAISGRLQRAELAGLLASAAALLEGDGIEALRCEVSLLSADAAAVDALARLALAARRAGCRVWVYGACDELRAMIAFAGLAEVLLE